MPSWTDDEGRCPDCYMQGRPCLIHREFGMGEKKSAGRIAVRVDAGRDAHGNPRRGWLVVDDKGETIAFVDHGYTGLTALRRDHGMIPETMPLLITPGAYRALRRLPTRSAT